MDYGYFSDNKKEYVITNMFPKRPWFNYLWNEKFISDINQFGFGISSTIDENQYRRKFMQLGDNRHIFIKDKLTGEMYSANRNYDDLQFDIWETHVGQGYQKILSQYNELKFEWNIFVPDKIMTECWEVKLTNNSNIKKVISLYPCSRVVAHVTNHLSFMRGEFSNEISGVTVSENGYLEPTDYVREYLISDIMPTAFDVSEKYFYGVYGDQRHPIGIKNNQLSCKNATFEENCTMVLQLDIELNPNETKTIKILNGCAKDLNEVVESKNILFKSGAFEHELTKLKNKTDKYDERINITTDFPEVDRKVNIWLKRQMELGKTWARVDVIGSRDTMQDLTGFVALDPEISREKLIDYMQYQKADGNYIRAWSPFLLRDCRDCSSWMISAVIQYIKETGDFSILDVERPFFESDESGTVLNHMTRAVNFLQNTLGKRGFPLWGECDWNDSMNACGIRGKGESLWLAEASIKCCSEFVDLLKQIGITQDIPSIKSKIDKMKNAIYKYGWDKDHFIYGFNDFDESVGSYACKEGKIYLNPQTWAVLSGIIDGKEANNLMDFVEKELSCDYGYVQQKPCYTIGTDHIGRVSYFQKGCYENGSVYNHGCTFKLVADCKLGRGEEALKTLKLLLPENALNDYTVSGVEPYAFTNMFIGPENKEIGGTSVTHWISGTSSWLFRGIVEFMLGIQAEYSGLAIRPCLSKEWKKMHVHRIFRNAIYEIDINNENPNGKKKIFVDGNVIDDDILPPFNDGKVHNIIVEIK